MEPILRWAGGKRRLVHAIAPKLLETYDPFNSKQRYVELFAGGAALFFYLQPNNGVLVDSCKPLINFYEALQREPLALYNELEKLKALPHEKSSYDNVRADWLADDFGVKFAAKMLYLNKLCFNGLFRLNQSKQFNVPWGKKKKQPKFPTLAQLLEYALVLKTTSLYCCDFNNVLRATHEYDTVYLDPPYWHTYDKYNGDGFTEEDHRRLAEACLGAVQRRVNIVASNIDCQSVRDFYGGWSSIDVISIKHQVGAKNERRRQVDEVIITARPSTLNNKQMSLL